MYSSRYNLKCNLQQQEFVKTLLSSQVKITVPEFNSPNYKVPFLQWSITKFHSFNRVNRGLNMSYIQISKLKMSTRLAVWQCCGLLT